MVTNHSCFHIQTTGTGGWEWRVQPPHVLGPGPGVLRGVKAAGHRTPINTRLRTWSAEGAKECLDPVQQKLQEGQQGQPVNPQGVSTLPSGGRLPRNTLHAGAWLTSGHRPWPWLWQSSWQAMSMCLPFLASVSPAA